MKVEVLKYADPHRQGWTLDALVLKDGVNLFVGASGSGKTRVLNMLFNIGTAAVRNRFFNGQWTIQFSHAGTTYTWQYDGEGPDHPDIDERERRILSERL